MVLNPCDNLCMVFDTAEFEEPIPPPILSKGMVKQFCESDLENTWWAARFSKQSIQLHNWDTQFRVSVSSGKWCQELLIFCQLPLAAKPLVHRGLTNKPCCHATTSCAQANCNNPCVLEPRLQNIPWNNAEWERSAVRLRTADDLGTPQRLDRAQSKLPHRSLS
jgi:hypothetical protein